MTTGEASLQSNEDQLKDDISKLQKEYLHLVYEKHRSELLPDMQAKRDVILGKVHVLNALKRAT